SAVRPHQPLPADHEPRLSRESEVQDGTLRWRTLGHRGPDDVAEGAVDPGTQWAFRRRASSESVRRLAQGHPAVWAVRPCHDADAFDQARPVTLPVLRVLFGGEEGLGDLSVEVGPGRA